MGPEYNGWRGHPNSLTDCRIAFIYDAVALNAIGIASTAMLMLIGILREFVLAHFLTIGSIRSIRLSPSHPLLSPGSPGFIPRCRRLSSSPDLHREQTSVVQDQPGLVSLYRLHGLR